MGSDQSSLTTLERPPGISHYLESNDVPSLDELLLLDVYLGQLSKRMDALGSSKDIVSDATTRNKNRLQREHSLFASVKSSIRKLPLEVLGIIFVFAVGTFPFNRYINVARLRGVCSSWRQAALTTPGLWDELTVDLSKWCPIGDVKLEIEEQTVLDQFKDELGPWMAIVARDPPFHLTLTSSDRATHLQLGHNQLKLVEAALLATPKPGAISIETAPVVTGAMQLIAARSLTFSACQLSLTDWPQEVDIQILEPAFPRLKTFDLCIFPLLNTAAPPFRHASLQTLHLDDLGGQGIYLQHLLQALPSLREARLSLSIRNYLDTGDLNASPMMFTHQSIEKLKY
jgi:F-box-like